MSLKNFLTVWVYIVPLPLFAAFFFYWKSHFNSYQLSLYLLVAPLLYGYIVPGIGTNVMKKWKFHGPFKLGNFYAHHGFKYSANMNLWFFIATYGLNFFSNLSWEKILITSIANGAIHGFFIWIHDTLSIKFGKIELTNILKKPGMSAEAQAFSFAPATFFALGFSFCLCNLYFIPKIMQHEIHWFLASFISFFIMMIISSTVFGILEMRVKNSSHN
jgi:hypothetical protein